MAHRPPFAARAAGLCLGCAIGLSWAVARAAPIAAQAPSGRFIGRVTNLADDRPIVGARIEVGADVARTDAQGVYRISVPPGRYGLRVSAAGFESATVVDQMAGLAVPGVEGAAADGDAVRVDVALPPRDPGPEAARRIADRLTGGVASPGEARAAAAVAEDTVAAAAAPSGAAADAPRMVRVLMPDGRILAMEMDEYLRGVVPAEMGFIARRAFEALRAQAIAARTYAAVGCLRETAGDPARCEPGLDANVDTTTRTQVWRPVHYDLTDAAVAATHGQVVRVGGGLVSTLYFARARERTLDSEASPCCGGRTVPYLRAAASPDPFDARRGHGAGLSQEGAAVLADWGASAEEILAHYYAGATVAPQAAPRLSNPEVTPRQATAGDAVRLAVTYSDADGDPPPTHEVVIDGDPRPMRLADPRAADYRTGVTWVYTATLAAGSHPVRFRFADGYLPAVELDAGSILVRAGAVAGASAPEDLPAAGDGVREGSAALDLDQFARVEGMADGVATAADDGAAARSTERLEGPVVEAEFPFMALAARWAGDGPERVRLAARVSRDGVGWSRWLPFPDEDGDGRVAPPEGEHWTRLVIARGRFVQLRIERDARGGDAPVTIDDLVVHYLDADDGPRAPVAAARAALGAVAAAAVADEVITRARWGADESVRFDADGNEIWPPEYTEPRAQIVHHTVTANDPVDPAAVVRSILHFHAVTRGWGDIGYNFLVDHRGNVYEGRFGGERPGRIVQGGHARQFNSNTIGVALLGTFTEAATRPSAAAERALVDFLAAEGARYRIDPQAPVTLQGTRFDHRVMGHRDVLAGQTQCPGQGVAERLDGIRAAVARRMAEMAGGQPTARPTPTPTRRPPTPTATARPPARPTPTSPPIGAGCVELVPDGGFEAGDPTAVGWRLNRAVRTSYDVYSGTNALFVGLRTTDPDEAQSYASAALRVAVPERVATARLRFFARTAGEADDLRLVRLMNDEGAVVALGAEALPATSEWRAYEHDVTAALTQLAGRFVRVYFGVVNNGDGRRSYLRLDDVSLVACPSLGQSTSPTATPALPSPAPGPTADPSPTPSVSPTPDGYPPPPPPATPGRPPAAVACDAPIVDGGFETATMGAWRVVGDLTAARIEAPVHDGVGALRLGPEGSDAPFGYAAVSHAVRIPSDVVTGTLTLWTRFERTLGADTFVVELRRLDDGVRFDLVDAAALGPPGDWRRLDVALGPDLLGAGGAGHPAELLVGLLHRGAGPASAVVVDEVTLALCRSGRVRSLFPSALRPQ